MKDTARKNLAEFSPAGDRAVRVCLGGEIHPDISARVMALDASLARDPIPGVRECVPGYAALLVHYMPERVGYAELARAREERLREQAPPPEEGPVLEIPVFYGGEEGPDLAFVARHCGMSEEEVIRRHTAVELRVYMLGFSPGFTYLGGMDPALATPRRQTPRVRLAAGSVGIAGEQTGVYPQASPGGWQIIGRTPLKLYDPERENPILPQPGGRIRFVRSNNS